MELRLLPLGSVVTLKHGGAKLVIIGRALMVADTQKPEAIVYDYAASLYPTGLDVKKTYYFNNEDVDKIVFNGYSDDSEFEYQKDITNWLEDIDDYAENDDRNLIDTSEKNEEVMENKSINSYGF